MREPSGHNLLTVSISPDTGHEEKKSFEFDYVVDSSLTLKFPPSMGMNGYCFMQDAVVVVN